MKFSVLGLCLIVNCYNAFCQVNKQAAISVKDKPPVTFDVLETWPHLITPVINSDASFFFYTKLFMPPAKNKVVLKALKSDWQIEFDDAAMPNFITGNRMVYFKSNDTICMLTLGSNVIEQIPGVRYYRLISSDTSQWMVYQSKSASEDFTVLDLTTNKKRTYTGIRSFSAGTGKKIVLLTSTNEIKLLDLSSGMLSIIWPQNEVRKGMEISSVIMDRNDSQLAFIAKQKAADNFIYSIWYYDNKTGKTMELLTNPFAGQLSIDNNSLNMFSKDGTRLFIRLTEAPAEDTAFYATKVNIWSYKDEKLQSEQLLNLRNRSYTHVINLMDKKVVRLEQESETIDLLGDDYDDYIAVTYQRGSSTEQNWNKAAKPIHYLVNTKTGLRKQVDKPILYWSPLAKFGFCIDTHGDYYSYEVATGIFRNITKSVPVPAIDKEFDESPFPAPRQFKGLAGWMKGDSAVLIYDRCDVWKVDLYAKKKPVNITNGYGRRNSIAFHLLTRYFTDTIGSGDKVLLSAFNKKTKENGFYSATIDLKADPEKLYIGPYLFFVEFNQASFLHNPAPVKAKNTNTFIVVRESEKQYPNFYSTTDFKSFQQVSFVHPEKKVNWLTSELINYKTPEGRPLQGILYKPENFDSTKKYPLIIFYYEKFSDQLHHYPIAEPIMGPPNIPWFVSHGYLIFTPDIQYKMGQPGRSAYNSVTGAAHYLSKLPFINSKRIGIYGHSFGGFETNYLITHSSLFAAAVSASGVSNYVSCYGSIGPGPGISLQFFYETDQNRIGPTLWQNPALYLENSPVLKADKVVTPLLMMNNKDDGIVPFNQGIEFFTGLRRLGKKVWLLQYDGKGHVVLGKESLDLTTRITQFMDHYLKENPVPVWMSHGIPAKRKGIESGLELDPDGMCGVDCTICQKIKTAVKQETRK